MNHKIGRPLAAKFKAYGLLIAAGVGIAATLCVPLTASGQVVGTTAGAGNLDEIIVTANKLNAQKVLDIPSSIQAISGDSLLAENAAGIMSIAGDVPGLSIQDLGPGDKKYVIRGINSTGDSTTGVYYGEAVISGSNADDGGGFESDIRLYDMDHIEVLRGPQGTLYGASSMSGTIRYIPKTPDLNNLGGYVTVEGSETQHASGNYNINGAINLPIIDGVLGLRVVGWKLYDSGYINQIRVGTGVTGLAGSTPPAGTGSNTSLPGVPATVAAVGHLNGINDDDVAGGRAIVRFEPTDKLIIDASFTSQTETSAGSSRYTPAGVTAFNNGGSIPPVQGCDLCNTDLTQSPWSDNTKVFGATVTYDTGVGVVTGTANEYNRNTNFSFDSTPVLVSFDVPVPAETFEPRERQLLSTEIRYASAFAGPVNFVAGVYREHDHQTLNVEVITTNGFGLPTGPFCNNNSCDAGAFPGIGTTFFGRTDERSSTSYATFGEVTWKITDAWTATAGIRYYTESLEGVQTQTHPFGGFPPTDQNLVPVPDPDETFNKVTWKANLSYKVNEGLLAYGTVSTGFRSGGLNAVSEPFEPIPSAYAPDSLTNFELGAKGRLFGGLFDYQADIYYIKWDNIQVQQTTPDAAFVYQGNAGAAKVKGMEFEFTSHPIQYLSATFAGSYTDAYLSDGANAQQYKLNPTLGQTGDSIPNVPKWQLSSGLAYQRPIAPGWDGLVATDVTHRGKENSYFASNAFNIPLSSYTLVGLRVGVIEGPWSVTAFARNLTNKRAQISAINSTQDPDALLTVQPRTFGMFATRKF
jgi:iron complex outermembrane receptor protein